DFDTVSGGSGNDALTAGGGDQQSLVGGSGNDTLYSGTGSNDTLAGGGGNDQAVISSDFSDKVVIDGGSGNDTVTFSDYTVGDVTGVTPATPSTWDPLNPSGTYTITFDDGNQVTVTNVEHVDYKV